MNYIVTSESVCQGHPDKLCDQISDAIVDAALTGDKHARVAVETLATKNFVVLAGEVKTKKRLNYVSIARNIIKKVGYTDGSFQFSHKSPIEVKIQVQSPEIAQGVDTGGAGDQGIMFGFACHETKQLMPMPIVIAHEITRALDTLALKALPFLKPDGKSQATVLYENGKPKSVERLVIAVPHDKSINVNDLKNDLYQKMVKPILEKYKLNIEQKNIILNGTGVWHHGGPAVDTGVTGRKIVVDSYGGSSRVGGGAFSGKDPTKVDRSGAYAARFLAKNIVAAKLADKAEVRLAFVIGQAKPLMQDVETFGTAKKGDKIIRSFMDKILDTSVPGILKGLNLLRPIYLQTATYGHFGKPGLPWENIAKI
ncbi:methionine adenosyltransferase [Candidatus Microgenomates bacterium]|nr:MAG: methionine adenosyltransferase [Candidatus Microgenomates bacterium]